MLDRGIWASVSEIGMDSFCHASQYTVFAAIPKIWETKSEYGAAEDLFPSHLKSRM